MGKEMKSTFLKSLSKYKKIAIDSMCFIYHFEGSIQYGNLTKELFSYLQTKAEGVTSTLTLAEILSFEKLQQDQLLFEEEKIKLYSTPNLEILAVDGIIAETASILKYKYTLKLPDAIQMATAIVSKQQVFISNDYRFKKVREIDVLILDDFR